MKSQSFEKVRSDLDEFRALIAGKLKLTKELEGSKL